MTKTEELRERMVTLIFEGNLATAYMRTDRVLKLLADMDCGFKVEKEIPRCHLFPQIAVNSYEEAQLDMLKAGFTGFEPIEVGK